MGGQPLEFGCHSKTLSTELGSSATQRKPSGVLTFFSLAPSLDLAEQVSMGPLLGKKTAPPKRAFRFCPRELPHLPGDPLMVQVVLKVADMYL